MTGPSGLLEVGRIGRAHGLKGAVFVDLVTDRTERLSPGSVLLSDRGDFTVISAASHQGSSRRFVVFFESVGDRTTAESLRGTLLRAERMDLDDTMWIDEFFGAELFDQSGTNHGKVVSVEANPASDLLVLENGALVPMTFVTRLVANERVDVDVPEGLFE